MKLIERNECSKYQLIAVDILAAGRRRGAEPILANGFQQFTVVQPCNCWTTAWYDWRL